TSAPSRSAIHKARHPSERDHMSSNERISRRIGLNDGIPAGQDRRARRRFLPALGDLEDRTVPSTLTVTNLLDSGPGSLRAAVGSANNGDTIKFALASASNQKTIALTSDQIFINKSLDIEGPGSGVLTISGGNHSRIFDISGAATDVTVTGLT